MVSKKITTINRTIGRRLEHKTNIDQVPPAPRMESALVCTSKITIKRFDITAVRNLCQAHLFLYFDFFRHSIRRLAHNTKKVRLCLDSNRDCKVFLKLALRYATHEAMAESMRSNFVDFRLTGS